MAALIYPFLRWNHKNKETPDYGPYALMDEDDCDKKITITGTIKYTIKEEQEKNSTPATNTKAYNKETAKTKHHNTK